MKPQSPLGIRERLIAASTDGKLTGPVIAGALADALTLLDACFTRLNKQEARGYEARHGLTAPYASEWPDAEALLATARRAFNAEVEPPDMVALPAAFWNELVGFVRSVQQGDVQQDKLRLIGWADDLLEVVAEGITNPAPEVLYAGAALLMTASEHARLKLPVGLPAHLWGKRLHVTVRDAEAAPSALTGNAQEILDSSEPEQESAPKLPLPYEIAGALNNLLTMAHRQLFVPDERPLLRREVLRLCAALEGVFEAVPGAPTAAGEQERVLYEGNADVYGLPSVEESWTLLLTQTPRGFTPGQRVRVLVTTVEESEAGS